MKKTNIGVIIQCRDESSRMKHKAVRKFAFGKSILEIIHDLLYTLGIPIVVATTEKSKRTINICKRRGYNCYMFPFSENEVADRLLACAKIFDFDGFFRVCADNPFIQPSLIYPIKVWAYSDRYDYVSWENAMERHEGFWIEYISTDALQKAIMCDESPETREHVTQFIRRNPWLIESKTIPIPDELNKINIRLTVDTMEDFKIAQKIYKKLGHAYWMNIIEYLSEHPKLLSKMKKNIERNPK